MNLRPSMFAGWILFVFFVGSVFLNSIPAECQPAARFIVPAHPPRANYVIDVSLNLAANRLEGVETIRMVNSTSFPLRWLMIDWPHRSAGQMQVLTGKDPVRVVAEGTNGLSSTQTLIELPAPPGPGEAVTLTIPFGFPLRLGGITILDNWHPRLWWEQNTADDYEVRVQAPKDYLLATSGLYDETQGVYSAPACRNFGLVFMKNLERMEGRSGDTSIYTYYEQDAKKCAELLHQTAIEVIGFYRNWLGFYPHKILHIIPGGLPHPAGGYPAATAIVGIHGQRQMDRAPQSHWQFITAHEIGHQYWMEHVLEAPDAFWLMIGLGVYADRAFMQAKGYGIQHERDMMQRYIQGVRDHLDTRMNRLPEEMEDVSFDYNNIVTHGKGFSVISALACLMGKEKFESAYKRCLNEYKGTILDPVHFQLACEEASGENLDWYFDPWIKTGRFLSYEIASRESQSSNQNIITTVKVRKSGTLDMPVPVTAVFEDGSQQCQYTDRWLDENVLVFSHSTPLKDLKLDAGDELPLVIPPPEATADQLKQAIGQLNVVGEGDTALAIVQKANPASLKQLGSGALFRLGMCLYDGKHDMAALPIFQYLTDPERKQTDPVDTFLGWVWQGHMLDILQRRDEAVSCYRRALDFCNDETEIRHDQYGMRITQAWVAKRLQTPFQRPDPKVLDLRNRISDLEWTGQGDPALRLFNEAKSIPVGDSGLPWGKLGLCLYDGKYYSEALQAFKNDFVENPSSFSSLVWQGHMLDLLNRRGEALPFYKQALDMNPTSWVRHDQYGIQIDRDWIVERLEKPFQRK
ncbi:MAG: M1 family aminopeptidase [bacterium]